ncbi:MULTISPECIES: FTR1 family iron permease [Cobetia]|uniref:FTR1 family iron permease n=1 Tax=Cobetia crustatorum TaxID=553385 RepID=A0A558HUW2_9GAMM|nr:MULTISPECIES: FTR1 family protein [Cobetia]TVU72909.1 FTR1 family iron permease [Cobetia crustatorum]
MFDQVLFIVWRESVEAILVVGIMHAWLVQSGTRAGLRYLWGGVVAGLVLAGLMGAALMGANTWLTGTSQEVFQAALVLIACLLITQMVLWMRTKGRTLKAELESGMANAVSSGSYWGVAILVAIAVAREGAETVVFLYGMGAASLQSGGIGSFSLAAGIGFALAVATFMALQLGSRLFSWKLFFRVTEILLLLLAASLLMSGLEQLIGLGYLPAGMDPLWDSSWLLDDGSGLGGLLATFAGYRAWPAATMVGGYVLYWVVVISMMKNQRKNERSDQRSQLAARARS